MENVKQKEFYKAEVGSPLQKALVDNLEAQKQLCEVIDLAIAEESNRMVNIAEEAYIKNETEDLETNKKLFGLTQDFINLITNSKK